MQHRVASIDDAVALAQRWLADGECQWFRGQKEPWPLTSTLSRIHGTWAEAEALEKINKFVQIVQSDAALAWLSEPEHVHAFFGCAQHYGIPTHYIDFTRSPAIAGFFATNNPGQLAGHEACIYCFETDFLNTVLEVVKDRNDRPPEGYPEIIRVEIDDLWRMHAQQGEFLYCPAPAVERLLAPRAIMFPFSRAYDAVQSVDVYPMAKSPLEQRLEAISAQFSHLTLIRQSGVR